VGCLRALGCVWCGLTFEFTRPAEAGAVSPVCDDATAGTRRAYSACRSGSGVQRVVRPHSCGRKPRIFGSFGHSQVATNRPTGRATNISESASVMGVSARAAIATSAPQAPPAPMAAAVTVTNSLTDLGEVIVMLQLSYVAAWPTLYPRVDEAFLARRDSREAYAAGRTIVRQRRAQVAAARR
jgi:hypothetical protein